MTDITKDDIRKAIYGSDVINGLVCSALLDDRVDAVYALFNPPQPLREYSADHLPDVGDWIRVWNPGWGLKTSCVEKFKWYDKDSTFGPWLTNIGCRHLAAPFVCLQGVPHDGSDVCPVREGKMLVIFNYGHVAVWNKWLVPGHYYDKVKQVIPLAADGSVDMERFK